MIIAKVPTSRVESRGGTWPERPQLQLRGNRRRWLALGIVCMAMLMNTLDGSVVNVALPAIQRDLDIPQADLTWVINAYLISFGSFLLLAGRLGDLVGPQARLPQRRDALHARLRALRPRRATRSS